MNGKLLFSQAYGGFTPCLVSQNSVAIIIQQKLPAVSIEQAATAEGDRPSNAIGRRAVSVWKPTGFFEKSEYKPL